MSQTASSSHLRVEHEMSLWKDPVKKRSDLSALSSPPPDRPSSLSLLVLLCLFSLVAVKVRMKMKRMSCRKMRRRMTSEAVTHLFGEDAPFLSLFPVLPPSAWSSHVPFLSLFLWRGNDWSSCVAVEMETDGTCSVDFAFFDFWTWNCFASLDFWTCSS